LKEERDIKRRKCYRKKNETLINEGVIGRRRRYRKEKMSLKESILLKKKRKD